MRPDTVQHVKVEAESDITSNFGGSRLLNPNSDNFSRLSIRAKAPLRISFAGGGTDVPPYPEQEGGCVLNATIDSFAWGSLRPRNDANIKLESADLGIRLDFTVDSKM